MSNIYKHITTKLLALMLVVGVLLPQVSEAAVVLRAGETVNITNDQVIDGDFYASGSTISSSGAIGQDFYALGGSFTSNGPVGGDLSVLGGSVQLHASVTDDVRVVGGETVIAGDVGGDVVVIGGVLDVLSTAHITGDILFFGGELNVLGDVDGSIMGTADHVRIDAAIGGDINMRVVRLSLGDNAEVLGDVSYTSSLALERGQNAVVVGDIVQNSVAKEPQNTSYEKFVVLFIVVLFAALVLQLVLRTRLMAFVRSLQNAVGYAGFIGIGAFLALPLLIVISLASMLGTLLGLLLLFGFLFLLFITIPLSCIVTGSFMRQYLQKDTLPTVWSTVAGAAVLHIVLVVPVVGIVAVIVVYIITLGAVLRALYHWIRA